MTSPTRYSPEIRERAVRLVLDHQGEHDGRAQDGGCAASTGHRSLTGSVPCPAASPCAARHTAPARVGLQLFGEQRRLAVPAQPLGLEVFALRLTPGHRLHASARLSGERAPSFPNPRFRPERAGLPLAHLGLERLNPVIPAHRALSLFSRIQLPPGTTCRAPSCPTRGNATAPAPRPPRWLSPRPRTESLPARSEYPPLCSPNTCAFTQPSTGVEVFALRLAPGRRLHDLLPGLRSARNTRLRARRTRRGACPNGAVRALLCASDTVFFVGYGRGVQERGSRFIL